MIRRGRKGDIFEIERLLYQVQKVHADIRPDIFRHGQKKYTTEELENLLQDNSRPIFVHENDEYKIDGYIFCVYQITKDSRSLYDRKVLYIDDLCVDERCRGNSIGTQLYEYAVKFAKENHFDSITLNVWNGNDIAYQFYEKCGLQPLKTMLEQKIK